MKHFIHICIALIFISCHSTDQKPNVVFIVADDLGWSQLSCYGSDFYESPNIDALSADGVRFTNAYAACPVCSPTRASIMTGKYPAKLHITDFIPGDTFSDSLLLTPDFQKFLPLDEYTIAEMASDAGYQTALFGKWHLSIAKTPPESLPYNPDKQGFDSIFVTYKPSRSMAKPWQTAENDAHNVDTITNLSVQFIEKNRDKPFFLVVSHNSIHDPLMEKQALIEKYKQKENYGNPENHAVVGAMIETLDKSVGTVLNKIDDLGIRDRTVVIFYSDNGGKHSYAAQTPFKAGKGWLYEGGIRVPLIIRWPGKINAGAVNNNLIISNDFYPTFNSIFNLDKNIQSNDGVDIITILKNDSVIRNTLYWHYPHYHRGSGMKPAGAIRQENFKLIEWYEDKLTGKPSYFELYNLEDDPGEKINLADSLTEKSNELLKLLIDWRESSNVQMPSIR